MSVMKPEVETDGEAIPTAAPTFATMPDSDISLPTLPDIGRHQELKMWPMVNREAGSRNNLYFGMSGVGYSVG